MLNFSEAQMEYVVIHKVGNKSREEECQFSDSLARIGGEDIQTLLSQYLLNPFRRADTVYAFTHTTDIRLNEVYNYVSQVFADKQTLLEQARNIALHLYENSMHPRVKGGEFYMVYLTNVRLDDTVTDAIGLFRTENKETYLKVVDHHNGFRVACEDGINIKSLDKGCLVLNTDAEQGYKVFIVDTHSKGANEARYWRDDFLRIKPSPTEDVLTQNYIQMVGHFVEERVVEEDKIKPLELRSKTVEFFEENDTFDVNRFEEEVLEKPDYIEAFREYRGEYQETAEVEPREQFQISQDSVKSVKKKMKSVIKLDTQVDIYVRGHSQQNLKNIERGHDPGKNMNYYKIYFNEEN